MSKIHDYDPYETDLTFHLEEGDVSIKKGFADFGKDDVLFFSAEIEKGDYVCLTEDNMTVKKATAKSDKIIGQVLDEPAFKGTRPTADATSGNYTKRVATIRLWGDYAHTVQLKAENKAVAVGDSVAYEGSNTFDKATSAGDSIALEKADALANSKILVLFGYRGL